ncbi:3-keto-disaccharide hydrolase [Paracidobacterium acidisoli]|uniref:DUF1080 domain-containing protein n=1 Tax=Paracidobacterium acidisoli TaxID=2303751 RepID=A0A372IL56_9BACT|nr:DUF1080 domain-containing protein [Paracidobacterium acidisoli]MBT9332231.1 DUF1080 domain-containing protein [Paracidobacterium acidisoli]
MKKSALFAVVIALSLAALPLPAQNSTADSASSAKPPQPPSRFREPDPLDFDNHSGYEQIFDGVDLKGWDGDPSYWRVEDGAIVGESTKDHPVTNTYISYHGYRGKDFDLKLEIKVENGGGSGIQYRSQTGLPWIRLRPGQPAPNLDWMMTGPQADFWYPVAPRNAEWTGQFYSENTPLGIVAWRGEVVESEAGKSPRLVGNIADRTPLGGYVRVNGWNQYHIIARGGTMLHILNGQLMAVLIDDDPKSSNNQPGLVGIELESTPSKVSVRNIWLKKISQKQ